MPYSAGDSADEKETPVSDASSNGPGTATTAPLTTCGAVGKTTTSVRLPVIFLDTDSDPAGQFKAVAIDPEAVRRAVERASSEYDAVIVDVPRPLRPRHWPG
ncbi:hypothetical protein [Polymorphospora sp. NPDC050346]|uniref:hypothetical protein n=1 Tax=Polymorphospora sp. NPDC050346 TaxID=3155780 RepID=UPI0033ECD169